MNRISLKYIFFIPAAVLIASGTLNGQSKRGLINDGVDLYKSGKYNEAGENFNKAINKEQEQFEGHFNLGDALYKMGKYEEAIGSYKNSLGFTEDNEAKAKAFYNIGNSLLKSQRYEESIDAYKNSLKLNPKDPETKYNLSYALEKLKQQQQNKQDKKDNKDQNKQDQKQDQNQNKDQQNKQDNKDQNKDQQQQQQQKNQISKNEAERILAALKNKENDLQKKLRQKKARAVPREKDW